MCIGPPHPGLGNVAKPLRTLVWCLEQEITLAATTSSVTYSISSDQISLRIFFKNTPLKNELEPDLQQQLLKLVTSDLSITLEQLHASRRSNGSFL